MSDRPEFVETHEAQPEIARVVEELIAEVHVAPGGLDEAQRHYLEEHALRKPLQVPHVWALGVGGVITGAFFGWNGGLGRAGPLGMIVATLLVCGLYWAWVLTLSELAVALPFAGGPLAYGRRAWGPALGFVMAWSMFLECLFAAVGTAIALGDYVAFVVGLAVDRAPDANLATVAALAAVAGFGLIQASGAKAQAKVLGWMTWAAIVALVWYWVACGPAVRFDRLMTRPMFPYGALGVLKAVPFAVWFLVVIEGVALAAEEAQEPSRTVPRGLSLALGTLVVLIGITLIVTAGAAGDWRAIGSDEMTYPLPSVYREVHPDRASRPHLLGFSALALTGMIASYGGILYAVSRQAFSLGRAGYLPRFLGAVHATRRTPIASIATWSAVIAAFVLWSRMDRHAVTVAVLTSNLTALLWYALASLCLIRLRRRDPGLERPYRVPLYPATPLIVVFGSLTAAAVYGALMEPIVLGLTGVLYVGGLMYFVVVARGRIESAAPEELAARGADS